MYRQIFLYSLFFFGFFLFFVRPAKAFTATAPIVPVSQFLSSADANGNYGANDCMAAALSMALSALSSTEKPLLNEYQFDYTTVRLTLRSAVPDINHGIAPEYLIAATPLLTGNSFQVLRMEVSPESWEGFLSQELNKGYPVIVHISDRNSLFSPKSTTEASHVIVVSGIDEETISFADSWDGKMHHITKNHFATAWGKGHYHWLAFSFKKQPVEASFQTIIKKRFNGHS